MKELRNCPFCKSNRVGVFDTETNPVSIGVHFDEPCAIVLCFNCAACAGFVKFGDKYTAKTSEEARDAAADYWNMREWDDLFLAEEDDEQA